jgi:hypothetical protein
LHTLHRKHDGCQHIVEPNREAYTAISPAVITSLHCKIEQIKVKQFSKIFILPKKCSKRIAMLKMRNKKGEGNVNKFLSENFNLQYIKFC